LQNSQNTSLTKNNTSGVDALVLTSLAAVCSFGILALGQLTGPAAPPIVTATSINSLAIADDHEVHSAEPTTSSVEISTPIKTTPARRTTVLPPSTSKASTKLPSAPSFITLLGDTHNDAFFYRSEYANPDGHYGGDWTHENISQSVEGVDLRVRRQQSRSGPFTAGEMKTRKAYGYGRYEAVMRPAKGSGLVSSFFTYTGEYEGNPHDEIDIEFLGLDTSRIHFNYFRKGRTGESATFDLPFDASEADHLYAFEWTSEGITWYVDGEAYYRTPAGDQRIPKTPGNVIFNIWTGKPGMTAWHGKPTFDSSASAHYSCISFQPIGTPSRACSDLFLPRRTQVRPARTAQRPEYPTP
jgi:endo-1,3-1,4-beta-glycanase ExoK